MAQRSSSRKPRSSGASRRGGKKSGSPVWAWLVAGLLVGLFIAFLVYLNGVDSSGSERPQQQASSEAAKEKQTSKESQKAKEKERAAAKEAKTKERETASAPARSEPAKEERATTPAAKEPAKAAPVTVAKATAEKKTEAEVKKESVKGSDKPTLSYDFYKILPKSEVVVPEEELKKPNSTAATVPGTYYLQVGAFRRIEEADSRKAELAMLGIVSAIQTVTVEANSSWHRVRVGPVKDARQLERSKRQLQDNNITFVTIRENN